MAKLSNLFIVVFALQLLVGLSVGIIFSTLPLKIAALIAASLFLSLGLFMLYSSLKLTNTLKSLLFWSALIHTFVFTLPMLSMRLLHWDRAFNEIEWLGVKATTLHNYSTPFYKFMMLFTLIDIFRTSRFCPQMVALNFKRSSSVEKQSS
ncbi:MAG: hypothetical protein KDD50_06380 [Bdellovibrionales bacterium]|nr:hypothetical protein [Bdellovibrionales bacterium]